jgi:DNA invertase Pin-like site-specific DNA recombinase
MRQVIPKNRAKRRLSSVKTERQITAAIYVRVSTLDQKHDLQLTELRDYAARNGWDVTEYSDKMSGTKARRPGLDRLMEDARMKRFDVLMVWKMDRFGRSLKDLITNILLLDGYGIRFIALTQAIDTDKKNPASRFMMHILAAVAEFEREMIVERVRAGVAEAQRQGKHCGRPKKIFRRDQALAMRAAGKSLRAIAKALEVPLSTVADALRR